MSVESVGVRLRRVRVKRGLTQQQLATAAGVTQSVIQKIEDGNSLRPRRIMSIARVLNVNPAWLQFGEEYASAPVPESAVWPSEDSPRTAASARPGRGTRLVDISAACGAAVGVRVVRHAPGGDLLQVSVDDEPVLEVTGGTVTVAVGSPGEGGPSQRPASRDTTPSLEGGPSRHPWPLSAPGPSRHPASRDTAPSMEDASRGTTPSLGGASRDTTPSMEGGPSQRPASRDTTPSLEGGPSQRPASRDTTPSLEGD